MMSVGFSKFPSLTLTLHLPASHSQCGAGLNHEFKTETLQINCVTLLMVGPDPPPPTHKGKQLWLIITWNAMIVVTGNQGHVIILILTWDSWWEGNQLPALSSRSLSWHCLGTGNLGPAWTQALRPGPQFLSRPPNKFLGPSVSPPRDYLSQSNAQSPAYFVHLASSFVFAWWHPLMLGADPVQDQLCRTWPGLGKGTGWPQLRSESSKHKQQPGLTATE